MRFPRLTPDQRYRAEQLLAEYRARPWNVNASIYALCGAAARGAKHGDPPNYRQRAAFRMHKKRRARLAANALYGDPASESPSGTNVPR
jgi:hypothetical protein